MKAQFAILLITLSATSSLHAQGTAFTYQGRLNSGANPVNGNYDFRFAVWNAESGPSLVSGTVGTNALAVSNGLFAVTLDFGPDIFPGVDRWLEINVRTNGSGSFDTLSPRQKITATPYAVTAGNLVSGGLAGTYSNAVAFSNSANSFTGNGSGLTDVNAATLGGIAPSNYWRMGGNFISTFPLQLGTIDSVPMTIIAGNRRALRLEPASRSIFLTTTLAPNLIGGSEANVVSTGVLGATIAGGGYINPGIGFPFPYPNVVSDDFGTISGGFNNVVGNANSDFTDASAATIGGGETNVVQASHATVSGGSNNVIFADSYSSVISGGQKNVIQTNAIFATVAGGDENFIAANSGAATISGGFVNTIEIGSGSSTIAGGNLNIIRAGSIYSTIGGGYQNTSSANWATIGGGNGNSASGPSSIVSGGQLNRATNTYDTVAGGYDNLSGGSSSTVAGGYANRSTGPAATIGGGGGNFSTAFYSTVAGGVNNSNGSAQASIGGGILNRIENGSTNSTISGGWSNVIQAAWGSATIGGGELNYIGFLGEASTIGGGGLNAIGNSTGSTIGGGARNHIGNVSDYNTISGGDSNICGGFAGFATIGGGRRNTCSEFGTTIAGGTYNIGSGPDATVGGGYQNVSSGSSATVGGGCQNVSGGLGATIPGGCNNSASGDFSFAAGQRAKAVHNGSFVWADSQFADFSSTSNNQFNIRANGGVRLNTDTSMFFGSQTRQMLNLFASQYGIGIQAGTEYFRSASEFCWFQGGVHSDGQHNPGGGTEMMRLDSGGNLNISGVFGSLSDRNVKERFEPVAPGEVLEKVAALPLSRWSYKTDPASRHLGPMAQDFYAAFSVGVDDKHIATVDADGVALAAIQGLNQKLTEELKRRDAENADLKQRLEALEKIIRKQTSN